MAVTIATPLQGLVQQIARHQAELKALQEEYESRQMRLAELVQRKVDLKAQLQDIEATIRTTRQGETGAAASLPARASTGKRGRPPVSQRSKMGRAAGRTAAAKTRGKRHGPPLRERLTTLLAQAKRPVPARELASQVLAGGYETKSKNFNEVIWVMLGQMKNVKNVPGEGYKLKR